METRRCTLVVDTYTIDRFGEHVMFIPGLPGGHLNMCFSCRTIVKAVERAMHPTDPQDVPSYIPEAQAIVDRMKGGE